jgi:O-antigen/teichoic acid export membrane protein
MAALLMAAKEHAGLPILLAATFGIQSLSTLLLIGVLVRRKLFSVFAIDLAVKQETSSLLRMGGLFFVLQVGTMVGWGADALIISSALGPSQVAVYSIAQRLFQFVAQPLSMVNMPLWGAYADAHVRGDTAFIRRTFKASMVLTLCGSVVGVAVIFLASEWILQHWTHGSVAIPVMVLASVATWTVFECCGVAFAMFLNGVQVVRQQVIVVTVFCALVLPLKIVGIQWYGLIAIPIAAILIYSITHIYFYGFLFLPKIKSFMINKN